jgi:cysteine desulfurase
VGLPIYLDNLATTRTDPRVVDAMAAWFDRDYGNAASRTHVFGWRAEAAVESARERVAAAIGASPREIVFTSGATESDNLALLGALRALRRAERHAVTVETEHRAVLDPLRALEEEGVRVTRLRVDPQGLLDPAEVARAIGDDTALVSVMAANNEIGVLQPIAEIGRLCRERGVLFHCDAAQALGKLALDVEALGVDLASFSGHKLYGPKGVGALYVRERRPRVKLQPLVHGGGHERGLRSGTLPVPLVVGFGRAVELAGEGLRSESDRVAGLRDRLWARLAAELPGIVRNGDPARCLPGVLSVSFEGVDGPSLLVDLSADLAVSSGAACSSASPEPSHVLAALGRPPALAAATVRFGIGRFNRAEEIERAADCVVTAVLKLRKSGRYPQSLAVRDR